MRYFFSCCLIGLAILTFYVSVSTGIKFWKKGNGFSLLKRRNGIQNDHKFLGTFVEVLSKNSELSQEKIYAKCVSMLRNQRISRSLDVATSKIKSSMGKNASLNSRLKLFLSKKRKNAKEASKISEYVTTVERSMQSCEVLQLTLNCSSNQEILLRKSGYELLWKIPLVFESIGVTALVLRPTSMSLGLPNDSILLSFVETNNTSNFQIKLLKNFISKSKEISIQSCCHTRNNVSVQIHSTCLGLSLRFVEAINRLYEESDIPRPKSVFVVGYSMGGAVATYVSLLLDGLLSSSSLEALSPKALKHLSFSTLDSSFRNMSHFLHQHVHWLGQYPDAVQCYTLACPPCLSRSLIPQFVRSLIAGDDWLCRISRSSWQNFASQFQTSSSKVNGKAASLWTTKAHRLWDKYRNRKRTRTGFYVPGRVFYLHLRSHASIGKKLGAIQRVFRGNWREELLWNLLDFQLSKNMIEHHQLSYYIQCLSHC